MLGDEKSRLKDAQNSAASLMIRALQQGQYVWQLLFLFFDEGVVTISIWFLN